MDEPAFLPSRKNLTVAQPTILTLESNSSTKIDTHLLSQVSHLFRSHTQSYLTLSKISHSVMSHTLSGPTLSQVSQSHSGRFHLKQVSHSVMSHTQSGLTLSQVSHSCLSVMSHT